MSNAGGPNQPGRREPSPNEPTPLQRAIAALDRMKARLDGMERAAHEPIAIVGMGCRFPGNADSPEHFFRVLEQGVDAVGEIPSTRWAPEAIGGSRPEGRWAGLVDDVAGFDAAFFGISPREAESLDPQQRMLLEVAWEALEDAGQRPDELVGSRTGVFVGICSSDYQQMVGDSRAGQFDAYCATGNMFSTAAGRVSFFFGFQGPAMSIDTACSSSLVALAQACQGLRSRDCDIALVGGVNAILFHRTMALLLETQALSPDGRCKALDARANGFVRGEGCGVVVLKRLSDALRDGDRIHALVRGWAVNQDGRSTGLTTPNVLSQQAMLRKALESARLSPEDVGYVEMHGTGTSLGDPIEAEALKVVLGAPHRDGSSCVLGAVKTNIGHLEGAAGVAGVIKVALAMEREVIPRNLHFRRLNPRIDFSNTPFVVPTENVSWPRSAKPRIAGVSSFGLSGTNAHVILEEAPREETKPPAATSAYFLPLSARSREACVALARSFVEGFPSVSETELHDIVYTAGARRSHHDHRCAVIGANWAEMRASLEAFARGEGSAAHGKAATNTRPKLVFVFSGQGSQWLGMGRRLLAEEPIFRAELEACDEALARSAGWSILAELEAPEGRSRIDETEFVQPILFALQMGLVRLLAAWGIAPDAVIGHSVGEIAAACAAGILTREEAIRLVSLRGRIMQKATGRGKMVWISLPAEEARKAIAGHEDSLSIAAVNDPGSVVLSGDARSLDEVLGKLVDSGIESRPLRVNYAFHSPQMASHSEELARSLGRIEASPGVVSMYSTVTGRRLDGVALDASYWARNVRETVDLAGAVFAALADGHRVFVEIGPHAVLSANLQQCGARHGGEVAVVPSLRRQRDERRCLLEALGALYVAGWTPAWAGLYHERGRVVTLPSYPWQKSRYWIPAAVGAERRRSAGPGSFLGRRIASSMDDGTSYWQVEISPEHPAWVSEHVVKGAVVFPGAGYVDMALSAAQELYGASPLALEHVSFDRMLTFAPGEVRDVQLVVKREGDDRASFRVASRPTGVESVWDEHAGGMIRRLDPERARPENVATGSLSEGRGTGISAEAHYRRTAERGIVFGPSFQGVERLWPSANEALGRITTPPEVAGDRDDHVIHPASLDACFQVMLAVFSGPDSIATSGVLFVPSSIERIRFHRPLRSTEWGQCTLRNTEGDGPETCTFDLVVFDTSGDVALEVEGFVAHRLDAGSVATAMLGRALFSMEWRALQPVQQTPVESGSKGEKDDGVFVIFSDRGGVGAGLADLLKSRGTSSVVVEAGGRFERIAPDRYRIDPACRSDYAAVLSEVSAHEKVSHVVLLWTLDDAAWDPATCGEVASAALGRCTNGIYLAQALLGANSGDPPRLWFVTRGAQAISKTDAANGVSQAALWGLGRTIAMEEPSLRGTCVDLDPLPSGDDASLVLREVLLDSPENQIAIRGGARHAARMSRDSFESFPRERAPIVPDATYLITGGLGGLGSSLVQWLFSKGARHFLLLGRSAPSPRVQGILTELRAEGASIAHPQVDITRLDELSDVLVRAREAMPPLRGVFHAAGVVDDAALSGLGTEQVQRVFAPKVRGAANLHALTRNDALDFFLMYSSAASLVGSPGQANYAAANAVLDALASARARAGLPGMSIQWGPFSEVGLAAVDEKRGQRLSLMGLESLSPRMGTDVLERLFERPRPTVGVMRLSVSKWLEAQPVARKSSFWSELAKESGKTRPEAPKSELFAERYARLPPGEARTSELEQHIRHMVGKVLRMDASQIDSAMGLIALGMDSLMAVELRTHLEQTLAIKVPASFLLGHQSIVSLSKGLGERMDANAAGESSHAAPQRSGRAGKTVEVPKFLLTGATGFLGTHLLHAFLRRTSAEIWCVLRAEDEAAGLRRIRAAFRFYGLEEVSDWARVVPIVGDVSRPNWGLSPRRFDEMARAISSIYHNAAVLDFSSTYETLVQSNVFATEEAIRLASASRGATLHYVSSVGVLTVGHPDGTRLLEVDVDDGRELLIGGGYTTSKLVAERRVRDARKNGLPAVIYRPGFISGNTRTGAWNLDDAVCRVIKGCIQVGYAPDVDWLLNLVPVDFTANAFLEISLRETKPSPVFHLVNPHPIHWRKIVDFVRRQGHRLEIITYEDWLRAIREGNRIQPNDVAPLVPWISETYPFKNVEYDTRMMLAALEGSDVVCSPIDERMLGLYFDYFYRSKFLSPPAVHPVE